MELVGGCGKHINIVRGNIHRDMSDCLYGVSMEQDMLPSADFSDLSDRLDRPDLIVGIHNGNQTCIITDRILYLRRINNSILMNIQQRNLKPLPLQLLQCMEHCVVFKCR